MQPFDLEIGSAFYAVFPEGNETYTIFKNGKEYLQIQKDEGDQWLFFDSETGTPNFEASDEVNQLGKLIATYKELPEDDEDEENTEDGEF